MTKAQALLAILEGSTVTVALHNVGDPNQKEYYTTTHIFGFELWDVPRSDSIVRENKIAKNYVGLFDNLATLEKKELRKYNPTKQRISIVRDDAEKVFIPDSVWAGLKISSPRKDQKLFLQCLNILFNRYKVRLAGMEDFNVIRKFWK